MRSQPKERPRNPNFSCGPCTKRPGWSLDALSGAVVGRSHRAPPARARLKLALDKTHELLGLPADYRVALVPGSDTGAFEMAMWCMLGARGVDVLAWEDFGKRWATDVMEQLRAPELRVLSADYGALPDLSQVDCDRDVIFAWNGTASGVRVPDGKWIAADREGLTFADATSAAFAQDIDWARVDVGTFSWQKVMGGEAAHGMLILSPRALERLRTHVPPWPIPKLFCLARDTRVLEELFEGETINTPSMLCVEDYLDALGWAQSIGGLSQLQARADANAAVIYDWIARTPWVENLAVDPATRSNTSVCMRFAEPTLAAPYHSAGERVTGRIAAVLAAEGVAHDIAHYRTAPPGLRVWCGATVERADLEALTPWLDWAYGEAHAALT
jgi:phosphoserine aminotransferase